MSHVATVEIEIKDLVALKAACAQIGLEFREGQETYKWYGRWVNDYGRDDAAYKNGIDPKDYGKCTHAIGVPKSAAAYEIGLVKQPDESYKMVWDFYAGGFGLQALAGPGCNKLVGAYAGEVAKRTLGRQGYMYAGQKTLEDGTVELVFNHA